MFTGIVEEVGTIGAIERASGAARIEVTCAGVLADAEVGDSIAVNGCCLTITSLNPDGFVADLMGETLERTSLGALESGDRVNLERPLRADGRFGGHVVQGHVDAVGAVVGVDPAAGSTLLTIAVHPDVGRYLVEKGSVAVEGVSLTVIDVESQGDDVRFRVGIIPHTEVATTLGERRAGDRVNIEVDILAKYVERLIRSGLQTDEDGR